MTPPWWDALARVALAAWHSRAINGCLWVAVVGLGIYHAVQSGRAKRQGEKPWQQYYSGLSLIECSLATSFLLDIDTPPHRRLLHGVVQLVIIAGWLVIGIVLRPRPRTVEPPVLNREVNEGEWPPPPTSRSG